MFLKPAPGAQGAGGQVTAPPVAHSPVVPFSFERSCKAYEDELISRKATWKYESIC